MGVITAQARQNLRDDSGFTFIYCNITGIGNNTYLGRAWKERPRVVFAYTYMGHIVNNLGWSTGKHPESKQYVFMLLLLFPIISFYFLGAQFLKLIAKRETPIVQHFVVLNKNILEYKIVNSQRCIMHFNRTCVMSLPSTGTRD